MMLTFCFQWNQANRLEPLTVVPFGTLFQPRRFESSQNGFCTPKDPNFEALGFSASKGLRSLEESRFFDHKSFLTSYSGAGGGTRTRTPTLAMDFESTSSTNSNTPASNVIIPRIGYQRKRKITVCAGFF